MNHNSPRPRFTHWLNNGSIRREPVHDSRPPALLRLEQVEERAPAATFLWALSAGGLFDWEVPANWGAANYPNANVDTATITTAPSANQTIRVNQSITIGTLNIGSTGAGHFDVAGNGGMLTFQVATTTGTATINVSGNGGDKVSAPIALSNNLNVTNSSAGTFTLGGGVAVGSKSVTFSGASPTTVSGVVGGGATPYGALPGPVAVTGGGPVTFTAANNYHGDTSVSSTAKLVVSNTTGSATGTGAVTVASGGTISGTGVIAPPPVLYAASFFDGALYQFDGNTGELEATLVSANGNALLPAASGMTAGPDGNLYISTFGVDSILKYDTSAHTLTTFIGAGVLTPLVVAPNAKFGPAGLAFGPDNNLYVTESGGTTAASGSGQVVRFDMAYTGTTPSYVAGTHTIVSSGLSQPYAVTFGPGADQSTMYIANYNDHNIKKTTHALDTTVPPSNTTTFIAAKSGSPTTGGYDSPTGVKFGPDGNFYITDIGANSNYGQVQQYSPAGTFLKEYTTPYSLIYQFPRDGVFDAQGRYLTANLGPAYPPSSAGSVSRFTSTGAFDTTLVSSSQFSNTGAGSGISPSQIVLVAAPKLTVAGTINPGSPTTPGILTVGNVELKNTATFTVAVNGSAAGTGYGQLAATGSVVLGGAALTLNLGYTPTVGTQLKLVSGATSITGTFANAPEGATLDYNGVRFKITYSGGTNHSDVVLTRMASSLVAAVSNFDSSLYEFDGETGALADTLVSPFTNPLLSSPSAVTQGPDGNLYIASQGNNTILKYDLGTHTLGTFIPSSALTTYSSTFSPGGLAFGPDGNLYVTLNGGQNAAGGGGVIRFNVNHNGNALNFAGTSKAVTTLTMVQPTGLAFGTGTDSTTLFISHSGQGSVVKVTGATTATSATPASFVAAGSNGLNYPSGLAIGPNGDVFVTDLGATSFQGQVLEYTTAGAFVKNYATPVSNLTFEFPSGTTFDDKGRMYVAALGYPGTAPGQISRYSTSGALESNITSGGASTQYGQYFSPSSIVALATPTPVLVSSVFDSAVYEVDSATGAVRQTLIPSGGNNQLFGPAGQTVAPDGNVVISSQFNYPQYGIGNAILKYNRVTGTLSTLVSSAVLQSIATSAPFNLAQFAPASLQYGTDGNLYVALSGGQNSTGGGVIRFNIAANGSYAGTYAVLAKDLVNPTGLIFGTASGDTGNLYVSNSGSHNVVKISGATGAIQTESIFIPVSTAQYTLNYPAGMRFGADGNFYLVDLAATSYQGAVYKFSPAGAYLSTVTPVGNVAGSLLFQFPSDLLFDGRGNLLTGNLGPSQSTPYQGSVNSYTEAGAYQKTLVSASQFPAGIGAAQLTAPGVALAGFSENNGAAQRSMVTRLDVTFDRAVVVPSGAFTLTRIGTVNGGAGDGATVTVTATTATVNGRTTATLTFSGANTSFGSLNDGKWKLAIDATKVYDRTTGEHLLANFDSVAAGVSINRLFGDVNANGSVDFNADLDGYYAALGTSVGNANYNAAFDFNANGTIDFNEDLDAFNARLGTSL